VIGVAKRIRDRVAAHDPEVVECKGCPHSQLVATGNGIEEIRLLYVVDPVIRPRIRIGRDRRSELILEIRPKTQLRQLVYIFQVRPERTLLEKTYSRCGAHRRTTGGHVD